MTVHLLEGSTDVDLNIPLHEDLYLQYICISKLQIGNDNAHQQVNN